MIRHTPENQNKGKEMAEDKQQFYGNIALLAVRQSMHLDAINSIRVAAGLTPITTTSSWRGELAQHFKLFRDDPQSWHNFEELLLVSLALGTQVKEFTRSFQSDWNIERAKAADVQLAKRKEMWLIWFQRLVRWVIGGCIAILFYSSIVWLQETTGFIKIPIRDWIHHESGKN